MRLTSPIIAFVLFAASFVFAAPYEVEDRIPSLASLSTVSLRRRAAINTGGSGDDDSDNADENEEDLTPPSELPGLENQSPGLMPRPEDVQEAREEEIGSTPTFADEGGQGNSALPPNLTEIVNRQARVMALLFVEQGLLIEKVLLTILANNIPYLTESSARQIVDDILATVRSADDPEAVSRQLLDAQLATTPTEEVQEQLFTITQFISANTDLAGGVPASGLVRIAENQSRLLASALAREGLINADLMAGYLLTENAYLDQGRAYEIAMQEINANFGRMDDDDDFNGGRGDGRSITDRIRDWWRSRGGGNGEE